MMPYGSAGGVDAAAMRSMGLTSGYQNIPGYGWAWQGNMLDGRARAAQMPQQLQGKPVSRVDAIQGGRVTSQNALMSPNAKPVPSKTSDKASQNPQLGFSPMNGNQVMAAALQQQQAAAARQAQQQRYSPNPQVANQQMMAQANAFQQAGNQIGMNQQQLANAWGAYNQRMVNLPGAFGGGGNAWQRQDQMDPRLAQAFNSYPGAPQFVAGGAMDSPLAQHYAAQGQQFNPYTMGAAW